MEQRLWMILQLFGGAALFLYSMDTLTDALQQAAGDTLRQALARLTAHPLAGVLTGAAVTAVVQSSSAVTVLVLGLVGAGLLTLQRAVPVVFGANIGTTVTAQLLAFRLEDARYLLLVAGLLLWFAGRGRLHAAGQALFAFGLLFEGIAVMAEAMEPLAAGPVFRQWMAQVRHRHGLGLLAGLFIVIRGIERVGIIDELSRAISRMGGGNLFWTYTIIVWSSVLISAFVDNIPYTATMLPVVGGVAASLGVNQAVLCFGLLTGATLGGNLTPVGASANIAACGILRREGYEVTTGQFVRIGVPFTLAAVLTGYVLVWLFYAGLAV